MKRPATDLRIATSATTADTNNTFQERKESLHVAKILTTSITGIALAFSMLASTLPANAAAGYHAAYFSESDFLAKSPGQTGQFAVGYTNTGDQAWVKGAAGQQANLATAAPLDNTNDFTAGWSNGWLSANRYTAQNAALVAPGQIGFFIYNFTVPVGAATGEHRFYGREVIDGVTFMEDYGYYQSVTVSNAGPVTVTSTNPASPSNNGQPVVNGTGAGNACAVQLLADGNNAGTGTSTATGTFSVQVTPALTAGSHTLSATSTCGTGSTATFNGSANSLTYVFNNTAPTVTGASTTSLVRTTVTFSSAMACTNIAGANDISNPANFTITANTAGAFVPTVTGSAPSTDCMSTVLTLSAPLTNGASYKVTVAATVTDQAGNAISSTANSANYTASDTTAPAATSAAFTGPTSLKISFSEPMNATGTTGSSTQNLANYTFDGVSGTTAFTACAASASTTTVTCTLAATPANGSHTTQVFNVADAAGNVISPNPTSLTSTYPPTTVAPTVTSVTGTTGTNTVKVAYSTGMSTLATGNGCANPANYQVTRSDGVAVTFTVVCSTSGTTGKSTATITLTAGGPLSTASGLSYSVTTSNVQDTFGNTISPNPTVSTVAQSPADTTAPTVTSAAVTQTALTVNFSEPMNATAACGTTAAPTVGTGNKIDNLGDYGTTGTTAALAASIASSTSYTTNADCSSITYTFAVGTPLAAGTYTLKIGTGTAGQIPADLALNDTTPNPTSVTVTAVDVTRPTAGTPTSSAATRVITETFSEPMAAATVTNAANYLVNSAALPAGTVIACTTAACSTVTITYPAGPAFPAVGSSNTLTISNVTDTSGNVITPNPTTKAFTGA